MYDVCVIVWAYCSQQPRCPFLVGPNSVLQGMDKNEEVSRVVKEVNRESWCFQNSVSPEKGIEPNIDCEFVL